MACLLQPECNFLHSFFRCKLPIEVVDVEVKIMSMQGTHIFRRDWTTQVIKCTPWLLLPNYLSNDNENNTENEPKNAASVTSPRPSVREEELKANDQEKCSWGPDCPFCKSQKKEEEGKPQQQKTLPKIQKPQAKRPNTLNLNMTKAKQQWEAEMERLNSK